MTTKTSTSAVLHYSMQGEAICTAPQILTGAQTLPPWSGLADVPCRTVALIDGANLHQGILSQGWKLDYPLFREHLAERYDVNVPLLFMGYASEYKALYRDLERWGYFLVFKPTSRRPDGSIKGNVDTDLAVWAISGYYENYYEQAILVAQDGDYSVLSDFLISRGKLRAILAPSKSGCSGLLKRLSVERSYLSSLRNKLEYREDQSNGRNPNWSQAADDYFADALGLEWPDSETKCGLSLANSLS